METPLWLPVSSKYFDEIVQKNNLVEQFSADGMIVLFADAKGKAMARIDKFRNGFPTYSRREGVK